jgi:hypothetical protein
MTELQAIEERIRKLPEQDFASLRAWFHRFEDELLSGYILSDDDYKLASEWLAIHPEAKALLEFLPKVVDQIYGGRVEKVLAVCPDPDTRETMIEVSLDTKLPMGPDFDDKEERLFKAIEDSNLSAGLRNVVISQR